MGNCEQLGILLSTLIKAPHANAACGAPGKMWTHQKVRDFLLSGLGAGFALAEEREHFFVERGDVGGLATANPIGVANDFFILPVAASIADVVLDGVITGQCAASG